MEGTNAILGGGGSVWVEVEVEVRELEGKIGPVSGRAVWSRAVSQPVRGGVEGGAGVRAEIGVRTTPRFSRHRWHFEWL
jgi:hypothetical protein